MAEEGPLANQTADFKICLLKNGHLPLGGSARKMCSETSLQEEIDVLQCF